LGRESWTYFLAMNKKIAPEILNWKEHALVGQAEMHVTLPCDGPRIVFNGVYANLVHSEPPHGNHVINGEFSSLVKNARFCQCYAMYKQ